VTKSVGGKYIEMFAKYIRVIFCTAFREAPNSVKKKLLTLLKTWYIFYPEDILNTIYNELGLFHYESELLTPDDHKKIKAFIQDKIEESKRKAMMKAAVVQRPPIQPDMS
jgi:hypothetical protein